MNAFPMTTFKHPGVDAMLEEIRAGNVATVIIKDQSRIFQGVLAVEMVNSIGRALRAEKIPIPSEHWKRLGEPVRVTYADPYTWSATTISYILKHPKYMGRKILGKTAPDSTPASAAKPTPTRKQAAWNLRLQRDASLSVCRLK